MKRTERVTVLFGSFRQYMRFLNQIPAEFGKNLGLFERSGSFRENFTRQMAASTGIFSSNNSAALRMTGSLIKRRTMQSSKHAFAAARMLMPTWCAIELFTIFPFPSVHREGVKSTAS